MFDNCYNRCIFYAHNLNFDGNIILEYLEGYYDISKDDTVFKRGDFYSLCITDTKKRMIFRCSAKIFPLPLADIAHIFNIGSKTNVDHSYASLDTINDFVFKNEILKYCENDVLLVTRFLEKIYNSVNKYEKLTTIYSISGLSLNIFKKNFNFFNISLENPVEFDDLIRPGYYGGRCEVFGNIKSNERCYHFDFSGMYTNRLMEKYPLGDYKINYNCKNINDNSFFYVSVYSNMSIPILPYRDVNSGKLLFPNGFFSGLYWGEELELFKENGGKIQKIHYSIEFNEKEYIFKEFAETCDKNRKKTKYDKILWKLIPNSFIGRLGLKYDDEASIIVKDDQYNPRNYDLICDKKINNNWILRIRKKNDKPIQKGNVMYPSIITSKARILWWKSSMEVIKNKGRILYCDTDSIFAAFKKDINPLGERHGEVYWDPEKIDTFLDDACFATSKVYCISYNNKSIVKIKGVSKKYIKDLDMKEFKKYFKNSMKNTFKTVLFEKKKFNIKIIELNKIIDFSSYDKRIFNKTKTSTKPITIKKLPYINESGFWSDNTFKSIT